MKYANHIMRAAAALLLGAVGFFMARSFLVPETFGVQGGYTYGYYRAAAESEAAQQPVLYQGSSACFKCHADAAAGWKAGRHAGVPCASCHGICLNGKNEAGEKPLINSASEGCLRCHRAFYGRPAGFPEIANLDAHVQDVVKWGCQVGPLVAVDNRRNVQEKGDVFAQGLRCVLCHNAHNPLLKLEVYYAKKRSSDNVSAQLPDNETGIQKERSW